MESGALGSRFPCYSFITAIQFTWDRCLLSSFCTGYRLFLEVFIYLKKGYLKRRDTSPVQ